MPGFDARSGARAINIWPGFVDALSALLMVIIFVLLVFVLAQFFMSSMLQGTESQLASAQAATQQQVAQISELRSGIEQLEATRHDLEVQKASLELALGNARAEAEQRGVDLAEQTSLNALLRQNLEEVQRLSGNLAAQVEALTAQSEQLETERSDLQGRLQLSDSEILQLRDLLAASEQELLARRDELENLRKEAVNLQEQLARVEAALSQSEVEVSTRDVQIRTLNARLNEALVRQVEELNTYRSEFFGRMRQILGDRPDIQIVGDRFVFQSEVLFPSGSADLQFGGKIQLGRFAEELVTLIGRLPQDVDWILRVDGHTDKVPIRTSEFASNWELSTARALSVVEFLINKGIPPERLAAAGFGEFQPLDPADTPEAYERNRRIELKLDQR